MSEKQSTPTLGKRDNEAEVISPAMRGVSYTRQQSLRRSTRGWRTFWLVLILVLPGIFIVFALTLGVAVQGNQTRAIPFGTSPATGLRQAGSTPIISSSVSVRAASIRTYKVFPPDAGLMLPAVD